MPSSPATIAATTHLAQVECRPAFHAIAPGFIELGSGLSWLPAERLTTIRYRLPLRRRSLNSPDRAQSGVTMRLKWKNPRNKDETASKLRRLDFHSTSGLIARRKRLRKQVGASLAVLVGLGLLLLELA